MKKIFVFCLLLIAPYLHAAEPVITPELLTLLDHFKIQHDGSLASITESTQKAWLRPKGKERWETDDPYNAEDRHAVLDYYEKTGKFQEKRPSKPSYKTALLCGATVFRMEIRLHFFERLIREGVQVEKVVLLTGARKLDPTVENIPEGCLTEGDAMVELWKESTLSKTIPWKHLQHPLIDLARRPGAYDTLHLWASEEPSEPVLIVTNQPYCCYYEAVAKAALPAGLEYEVVGESADPASQKTDILLDNLARWIYTMNSNN